MLSKGQRNYSTQALYYGRENSMARHVAYITYSRRYMDIKGLFESGQTHTHTHAHTYTWVYCAHTCTHTNFCSSQYTTNTYIHALHSNTHTSTNVYISHTHTLTHTHGLDTRHTHTTCRSIMRARGAQWGAETSSCCLRATGAVLTD